MEEGETDSVPGAEEQYDMCSKLYIKHYETSDTDRGLHLLFYLNFIMIL